MKNGYMDEDAIARSREYDVRSHGSSDGTAVPVPGRGFVLDDPGYGVYTRRSKVSSPTSPRGYNTRAGRSESLEETHSDFTRTSYAPSVPGIRHVIPERSTSIPDFSAIRSAYHSNGATFHDHHGAASSHSSTASSLRRPPTFWRDGGVEDVRQSYRSALTERSSGPDLSITERSSFITSNTSDGENSIIRAGDSQIQEEEMSVDDVFSLYAGGFGDEPVDQYFLERKRSMPSSPLALSESFISESRPYTAIPDDRSARPPLLPSPHSDTTVARSSTQATRVDAGEKHSQRSNAGLVELRDRYGFKRSNQYVSLDQYNEWNSLYTDYLEIRRLKWQLLMKRNGLPSKHPTKFPPRNDKVKKYIRKGIPPEWRGAAWFWYADGPTRVTKNPGLYKRLVKQAEEGVISETDREHIERDLNRTFPDNVRFKPDRSTETETSILRALRRVLQAFAIYRPKIGYCQSLNFLAGLLLIFLNEDEEKAFFMLEIITSEYLPGTHGVALEGANIDIGVLMSSIKDSLPALWAKVDDRKNVGRKLTGDMRDGTALPTISLATTAWFMSCFVSTLPIETTLRVWDCLFYEGSKTLFRIALTIFKANERQMLVYNDPMEIFQLVQTLPRKMIDANDLMETCYKRKIGVGLLSQDKIDSRRAERRKMYARERNEKSAQKSMAGESRLNRMASMGRLKSFSVNKRAV